MSRVDDDGRRRRQMRQATSGNPEPRDVKRIAHVDHAHVVRCRRPDRREQGEETSRSQANTSGILTSSGEHEVRPFTAVLAPSSASTRRRVTASALPIPKALP